MDTEDKVIYNFTKDLIGGCKQLLKDLEMNDNIFDIHDNIKNDKNFGFFAHISNMSPNGENSPYYYLRMAFIEAMYMGNDDYPQNYDDYVKHMTKNDVYWSNMQSYLVYLAPHNELLDELQTLYKRYQIEFTWNTSSLLNDHKRLDIKTNILTDENKAKWLIEKESLCKWLDKAKNNQLPPAEGKMFLRHINDSHRVACCYYNNRLSPKIKTNN